jgi:hypothetical protein
MSLGLPVKQGIESRNRVTDHRGESSFRPGNFRKDFIDCKAVDRPKNLVPVAHPIKMGQLADELTRLRCRWVVPWRVGQRLDSMKADDIGMARQGSGNPHASRASAGQNIEHAYSDREKLVPVVRPTGLRGHAAGNRAEGWANALARAEPASWLPRSVLKMSGLS